MFEILRILKNFEKEAFTAGQIIISPDDTSKTFYVLIEGRVSVVKDDMTISSLAKPGTILGEISTILNIPRNAKIVAEKDSTFYVVRDLPALFRDNIDVCIEITRLSIERLMNLVDLQLQLKNQFIDAATTVGLDISTVPEIKKYITDWEELQKNTSEEFPFILKNEITEGLEITIDAGDILFEEGDWVGKCYILKKGKIRVSRNDNIFSYDISELGTVLNVGYTIENRATILNAKAIESSVIHEIEDMKDLFKTDHSTGFEILRQISQRIVKLNEIFARMKNKILNIYSAISQDNKRKMENLFTIMMEKEEELKRKGFGS